MIDAQDLEALAFEPLITLDISLSLPRTIMSIAIHFNDQTAFEADEIRDEEPDLNLSPEPMAGNGTASQSLPESALGRVLIASQMPHSANGHFEHPPVDTPLPIPPPQGGRVIREENFSADLRIFPFEAIGLLSNGTPSRLTGEVRAGGGEPRVFPIIQSLRFQA